MHRGDPGAARDRLRRALTTCAGRNAGLCGPIRERLEELEDGRR